MNKFSLPLGVFGPETSRTLVRRHREQFSMLDACVIEVDGFYFLVPEPGVEDAVCFSRAEGDGLPAKALGSLTVRPSRLTKPFCWTRRRRSPGASSYGSGTSRYARREAGSGGRSSPDPEPHGVAHGCRHRASRRRTSRPSKLAKGARQGFGLEAAVKAVPSLPRLRMAGLEWLLATSVSIGHTVSLA